MKSFSAVVRAAIAAVLVVGAAARSSARSTVLAPGAARHLRQRPTTAEIMLVQPLLGQNVNRTAASRAGNANHSALQLLADHSAGQDDRYVKQWSRRGQQLPFGGGPSPLNGMFFGDENKKRGNEGSSSEADGGSCHPKCWWSCGTADCDEVCDPVCAPPQCETACEPINLQTCTQHCDPPNCAIVCPTTHCEHGDCPGCKTVCGPPNCTTVCAENCESRCAEPQCTWKCNPGQCEKPMCKLTCGGAKMCKLGETNARPNWADVNGKKGGSFYGPGRMHVLSKGLAALNPMALAGAMMPPGAPSPAVAPPMMGGPGLMPPVPPMAAPVAPPSL